MMEQRVLPGKNFFPSIFMRVSFFTTLCPPYQEVQIIYERLLCFVRKDNAQYALQGIAHVIARGFPPK